MTKFAWLISKIKKQLWWTLLIITLVLIDQLTKALACFYCIENPVPFIPQILDFKYTENTGAAWSILSGKTLLLSVFTGILLLALLILLFKGIFRRPMEWISIVLIVSGGLGNLIDRIFRGYVIDFIHTLFMNFPIFNFADCCVCVGACLMLLAILIYDMKDRKEGTSLGTETASDSGDSIGRTSGQSDCQASGCNTVDSSKMAGKQLGSDQSCDKE